MFLYVNSTFAPSMDEVVGNLHRVSYYLFQDIKEAIRWQPVSTTETIIEANKD